MTWVGRMWSSALGVFRGHREVPSEMAAAGILLYDVGLKPCRFAARRRVSAGGAHAVAGIAFDGDGLVEELLKS